MVGLAFELSLSLTATIPLYLFFSPEDWAQEGIQKSLLIGTEI